MNAPSVSNEQTLPVLLVGGEPRPVRDDLLPKLSQWNIDVRWHWPTAKRYAVSVPVGCKLVLILRDWASHGLIDMAKNAARRSDVRFLPIPNKWSRIQLRLRDAGLTPPPPELPRLVEPEALPKPQEARMARKSIKGLVREILCKRPGLRGKALVAEANRRGASTTRVDTTTLRHLRDELGIVIVGRGSCSKLMLTDRFLASYPNADTTGCLLPKPKVENEPKPKVGSSDPVSEVRAAERLLREAMKDAGFSEMHIALDGPTTYQRTVVVRGEL